MNVSVGWSYKALVTELVGQRLLRYTWNIFFIFFHFRDFLYTFGSIEMQGRGYFSRPETLSRSSSSYPRYGRYLYIKGLSTFQPTYGGGHFFMAATKSFFSQALP